MYKRTTITPFTCVLHMFCFMITPPKKTKKKHQGSRHPAAERSAQLPLAKIWNHACNALPRCWGENARYVQISVIYTVYTCIHVV
jgi:hypothetical protein